MIVVVKDTFYDIKEDVVRKVGDEFECTQQRFDEINNAAKLNYGSIFVEKKESKKVNKKKLNE